MADLSKEIKNALEFVKKDWDRLPGFVKFCYVVGIFALLSAWLVNVPDKLHSKTLSFWLIVLIFLSVIATPGIYWAITKLRVYFYRIRYPIKNIGKDYRFANLGGAVHIVDSKRKVVRWIENPKTLYDLGFLALAWTDMTDVSSLEDIIKKMPNNGKQIKFTYKRGIKTGGKPGEGKV